MASPTGLVFDIRRYAVHDGPGIRTTVFLKGCPLNCWWCHNPESQSPDPEIMYREARCAHCGQCLSACPQNAIAWQHDAPITNPARCTRCGACAQLCPTQARELTGECMSVEHVMRLVRRDIQFYDESGGGVTLSGGEPLYQSEFTAALLRACKKEEIHTALDTSGFAAWQILDDIRSDVDCFLYDIKLLDDARHIQYTGVSNQIILENLHRLAQRGHAIILRLPLIPGITDGEENIQAVAQLARSLPTVLRVDLLPYHDAARLKYQRLGIAYPLPPDISLPAEHVNRLASILQTNRIRTKIGG